MESNVLIKNGTLITPEKTLPLTDILIENGKITNISPDIPEGSLRNFTVIDAEGLLVLPGLIDIHTHGGWGSDFMDASGEAFTNIAAFQASHGVTSIFPTTVAAPIEYMMELLGIASSWIERDTGGARFCGIHLEGPYLSVEHRGAHQEQYLLTPKSKHLEALKEFRDVIKTVTMAPELPGAMEAVSEFSRWGVLVSGGHDMAYDDVISEAINRGMRHTTHVFCVMSGLRKIENFRTLGLNEHTLLDDRLSTEIIADNRHIPPLLAKLVYTCKGSKNVCLVSDCIRAAGMPMDGTSYSLGRKGDGGGEVVVAEGVAMTPDGSRFAGSITTLDAMVRNMVKDADIPLVDAVRMATLTPAEIHRIDNRKGSLRVGNDGDVCIADSDLYVQKTVVAGNVVYSRENEEMK